MQIEISGGSKVSALYSSAPDLFNKHLRKAVTKAAFIIEAEAKRRVPQATRALARSIASDTQTLGGTVSGIVTVGEPYGIYVEYGRGAGKMPPYKAGSSLALWAKAVGIISSGSNPTADDRSHLFLIARNIGRYGVKERPFLMAAFRDSVPKITRLFEDALQDITTEMAN